MELLIKQILKFYPKLPKKSLNNLLSLYSKKEYKKSDFILKINQIQYNMQILYTGIVRSFIIDTKDKEHTKSLIFPIYSFGNTNSMINRIPSDQIYQCLTDCALYVCDYKKYEALAINDFHITILNTKVLESYYAHHENLIIELTSLTPFERYKKLLQRYPQINQHVNQYHIASYLNITPVQFSRLKKNTIILYSFLPINESNIISIMLLKS